MQTSWLKNRISAAHVILLAPAAIVKSHCHSTRPVCHRPLTITVYFTTNTSHPQGIGWVVHTWLYNIYSHLLVYIVIALIPHRSRYLKARVISRIFIDTLTRLRRSFAWAPKHIYIAAPNGSFRRPPRKLDAYAPAGHNIHGLVFPKVDLAVPKIDLVVPRSM